MFSKKILPFCVWCIGIVYANDCPRFAPISVEDILTVIPIYKGDISKPDADCDGLSDAQERKMGTDPNDWDSDNDMVSDYDDDYPLDPRRSKDVTPPVMKFNGAASVTIYRYWTYIEPGVTATDDRDGRVTVRVLGSVNTKQPGTYKLTYIATDSRGNKTVRYRTVTVKPDIKPQTFYSSSIPKDSHGNRPIDTVKKFLDAFQKDDKERVKTYVSSPNVIRVLYDNPDATAFLKGIYRNIFKMEEKRHEMGETYVTITFIAENAFHQGGFELHESVDNNGKMVWKIRWFY